LSHNKIRNIYAEVKCWVGFTYAAARDCMKLTASSCVNLWQGIVYARSFSECQEEVP